MHVNKKNYNIYEHKIKSMLMKIDSYNLYITINIFNTPQL